MTEEHVVTYLSILAANTDNVDWRNVACLVLHIDAAKQADRGRGLRIKPSFTSEVDDASAQRRLIAASFA
jgi:hypothetical protein